MHPFLATTSWDAEKLHLYCILHIAWDGSWDSRQNMHYETAIFSGSRNFFYIGSVGTQFLRMETYFKGNL